MDYRVEDLAAAGGVSVDTVRFWQGRGLLPPARRAGRTVVYDRSHLERIRRIRAWQAEGLPLAVIARLVEGGQGKSALRAARGGGAPVASGERSMTRTRAKADSRRAGKGARRASSDALVRALVEERGPAAISRSALAELAGVPEELIAAVVQAGIIEPVAVDGREAWSPTDVELARSALALLREGLPIGALLGLALAHSGHVREIADRAIELFMANVRRGPDGSERPPEEVALAFQRMIPAVTSLVAHHFHRTLVARALARLERAGERAALATAIEATRLGTLEVAWR
jgi:DNA-binding transcriptional MerR regulator